MNRLLIGLLFAALLATGLVGWYAKSQVAAVAALKSQNKGLLDDQKRAAEALKKAKAVLRSRETQIASQSRKLADSQRELQTALRANKSWSDTDVPPDVQKALGGLSGRAPDGLRHQDSERSPASGAPQGLPDPSGASSE